MAWSVLLLLCLTGFGLSIIDKVKIRRFNPNVGDPQARLEIGRNLAVTRAEFEKAQQETSKDTEGGYKETFNNGG